MILLREVQQKDLAALERFSQIPGFINIPDDREQLKDYIRLSTQSFTSEDESFHRNNKFVFVAEEESSVGCVMVKEFTEVHPFASVIVTE